MRPSTLDHDAFLARFGPVYEDSPWVAEAVWPAVERGELDDLPALAAAMRDVGRRRAARDAAGADPRAPATRGREQHGRGVGERAARRGA